VPDVIGPLPLRRVVVACKDARECRRAVRDALPFLREANEVLVVEIGEEDSKSEHKRNLADIRRYLTRHGVIVADEIWKRARGPVATELLELVRAERADLIVSGGYGHTRLGEWIFGGVTQELLASSPVCCMLSH
ncbi:MAG: universal stress protein, partial [Pseudolabrys sp.]